MGHEPIIFTFCYKPVVLKGTFSTVATVRHNNTVALLPYYYFLCFCSLGAEIAERCALDIGYRVGG